MFPLAPRSITLFAVLLLLSLLSPAHAAGRDPFSGGSMRASLLLGSGYAFDESYAVVGAGFGYFIAQGLELGIDGEYWTGGDPGITKISASIRYVLPAESVVRPYAGVFFRRTMIENREDLNSTGGRAGIYLLSGRGSYFGAGAVYEKYLSCDEAVYRSCSDTYPEIVFAIAF